MGVFVNNVFCVILRVKIQLSVDSSHICLCMVCVKSYDFKISGTRYFPHCGSVPACVDSVQCIPISVSPHVTLNDCHGASQTKTKIYNIFNYSFHLY